MKKILLLSIISIFTLNNSAFAYKQADLDKARKLSELNKSQIFLSKEEKDLRNTDLYGANLYGAGLVCADLRNAILSDASLRGANLESANLESADLESADLRNAYLEGANLEDANLEGANLEGAKFIKTYGLTEKQIEYIRQHVGIVE